MDIKGNLRYRVPSKNFKQILANFHGYNELNYNKLTSLANCLMDLKLTGVRGLCEPTKASSPLIAAIFSWSELS